MDPFCYLCFVLVCHTVLSVPLALWLPAGKGLTSWLLVYDVFLCLCHVPI